MTAELALEGDLATTISILNHVADLAPDYPGLWHLFARIFAKGGEPRLAGFCAARASLS